MEAIGDPSIKCDGVGCVIKHTLLVAVSQKPEALAEDCAVAKIVVSAAAAPGCKTPVVVIDRDAAMTGQGWRVRLSPEPSAQSVRAERGMRPWVAVSR